jgi:hypothetical protein
MPRRRGRPGLMGTMARTAVVAGTATAVSGSVQRSAAQRTADQQSAAAAEQPAVVDQAAAPAVVDQAAAPAAAPAAAQVGAQPAASDTAAPADDPISKIRQLGELKAQGLLSDEEFTAAKAKLLGI